MSTKKTPQPFIKLGNAITTAEIGADCCRRDALIPRRTNGLQKLDRPIECSPGTRTQKLISNHNSVK